jgi:hypothetical protein
MSDGATGDWWNDVKAIIKDGYRNWNVYNARSSRTEFWIWIIHAWLLIAVSMWLEIVIQGMGLVFLIPFVPSIAMWVRRIHDTGHRIWWCFIPGIGGVINLVLLLSGTNHSEERWARPSALQNVVPNSKRAAIENPESFPAPISPTPPEDMNWPPPRKSSGYTGLTGWYKDPSGRHKKRYFDGSQWTEQVRPTPVSTTSAQHLSGNSHDTRKPTRDTQSHDVSPDKLKSGSEELLRQFKNFAELYEKGLLTDDEYAEVKRRLLNR